MWISERGSSDRVLTGVAALLAAAFVLAPAPLAAIRPDGGFAGQGQLAGALRAAFAEFWRSGGQSFSPSLTSVVDYWLRYHLVKAVTAALLFAVLAVLGARLWKAFTRGAGLGAGRRAALASAGVAVTALALFSLALVMANVQGSVTPFASLLPMLLDGPGGGESTATLDQVRQRLADGGQASPALQVMIDDFARYHVAMAVIAGVVAAGITALSVLLWRRFAATARTERRTRRVLASFGVVTALLPLVAGLIAVANTTTALDPAPALLAFFEGGW
ncbi:hypothetical protein QLQ12_02010 [Actinoplanes sp. NEAU-A12]|uniref:Tat (Twin-arginine translocation) pathway signal sequence n=1 Tax=Actinoplanes sandaracinus TaxID=3045177 RepID=A0ABT6WCC7_9ACTN|nr:hypothetical protein [Actinoplanes sandaracinus]MDI6097376.1 hypothetical protein [Actinoplanes sandaracinus]